VVLSLFKSGGSTALVARLYVSGASETMTALAGALGLSVAAVSRIVATAERDALVSVTKVGTSKFVTAIPARRGHRRARMRRGSR
jgi:DNA-binding MarR family transcriptional regulator